MRYMRAIKPILLSLVLSTACFADLTKEQKLADFMQLAGLYAKNYAPYQWKRDVIGFDLYNLKPWLDQVNASKTDLDFWDICVKYVAALQDSHDEFTLPSSFYAYMHFDVDIYDGKVLIDGIDRKWLPKADFPFTVGDELVSVDGTPVADLIKAYIPYAVNGSANTSTRRRLAADTITFRYQGYMPRAHEVPDESVITVLRASGDTETYSIKWDRSGTPITTAGTLPNLRTNGRTRQTMEIPSDVGEQPAAAAKLGPRHAGDSEAGANTGRAWGVWQGAGPDVEAEVIPGYLQPLRELQQMSALQPVSGAATFGLQFPAFDPPPGFRLRLGASRNDFFLSGTFTTGGVTVGFIRIPTMSPASGSAALQQFAAEMAYFEKNTSGLVIDVMRNGGGSLCYDEALVSYLTSGTYTAANYNIRASALWLTVFGSALQTATDAKAPQWQIDLYSSYVSDMKSALADNRAMTGTLPICGPLPTLTGQPTAYSKPIVVLVDEFSLSAAEAFSMMLQDAGRATIVGVRTDGGGGNPASYSGTTYSEGLTRVTRTFVVRGKTVQTPGFPPSQYLENTGVYPDVQADIMTVDNLMSGGAPFLTQVGLAMADLLSKGN